MIYGDVQTVCTWGWAGSGTGETRVFQGDLGVQGTDHDRS